MIQSHPFATIFVKKLHANSWGLEILIWIMCQCLCVFFVQDFSDLEILYDKESESTLDLTYILVLRHNLHYSIRRKIISNSSQMESFFIRPSLIFNI